MKSKKSKRLLSWLVLCAMLLSMLPGMAITGAAEEFKSSYAASSIAKLWDIKDAQDKQVNVSNNSKTVAAVIWKDTDEDLFYLAVAAAKNVIEQFTDPWAVSAYGATLTVTVGEETAFSEQAVKVSPSSSNSTTYWCVTSLTREKLGTPEPWGDDGKYYRFALPVLPGGFDLENGLIVPADFVEEEIIGNAITGFTKT